jgi:RHS repeat-associated protein
MTSTVDLDAWGGETGRSSNAAFQPHLYTTYERDANGGDDAMMRRNQSSLSRFFQPDPYDGSYNFGDPQSLNRYAYVQNDPVNFTDPSGLNLEAPGSGGYCIRYHYYNPSTGEGFWGSWQCYGGGGDTGGRGGLAGTEVVGGEQREDTRTSCERFADLVEQINKNSPYAIASDFVNALYSRFGNSGTEFSSDGFKAEFQDFSGSPNQARHYVGGLYAGFTGAQFGSEAVGRAGANAREVTVTFIPTPSGIPLPSISPPNPSQRADRALNGVSTRHGGALSNEKLKPYQLADLIRKEICAQ